MNHHHRDLMPSALTRNPRRCSDSSNSTRHLKREPLISINPPTPSFQSNGQHGFGRHHSSSSIQSATSSGGEHRYGNRHCHKCFTCLQEAQTEQGFLQQRGVSIKAMPHLRRHLQEAHCKCLWRVLQWCL